MKFALLYAGPFRSSEEIIKNHKYVFGEDIDIYVSCFNHYMEQWSNSGFNIKEIYTTPNIKFFQTNWSKYRNDNAGQSGFWQFWNLRNVINSVPKKYDFYIKCRNDLFFNNSLNRITNEINLKQNVIYSSDQSFHRSNWDKELWINDEFYIGCENSMKIISNYVTDFFNTPNRQSLNEASPYVGSNESNLRKWLKENKIEVEKIYNFSYYKDHYKNHNSSGITEFQLENLE